VWPPRACVCGYAHCHLVIRSEKCQETTYNRKTPRNLNHNFDSLLSDKKAVGEGPGDEEVPVQA
jgi:hypothetical protein